MYKEEEIDNKVYFNNLDQIEDEDLLIKESSKQLLQNFYITKKIISIKKLNKNLKEIFKNDTTKLLLSKNKAYKLYKKKLKELKTKKFQKRIRKKKEEINRSYICDYEECGKSYGSKNSLYQHINNKHKK